MRNPASGLGPRRKRMKNHSFFCFVLLAVVVSLSLGGECDQKRPGDCGKKDAPLEVTISEIVKEGPETIVERRGAGGAAVIGAVGGAALAAATGGVPVLLGAVGGGAVGAHAGDKAGTTNTFSVCRFRVEYRELPLVYYGNDQDDDAFQKCTMFHVGDRVFVEATHVCYQGGVTGMNYMWRSGDTTGWMK